MDPPQGRVGRLSLIKHLPRTFQSSNLYEELFNNSKIIFLNYTIKLGKIFRKLREVENYGSEDHH